MRSEARLAYQPLSEWSGSSTQHSKLPFPTVGAGCHFQVFGNVFSRLRAALRISIAGFLRRLYRVSCWDRARFAGLPIVCALRHQAGFGWRRPMSTLLALIDKKVGNGHTTQVMMELLGYSRRKGPSLPTPFWMITIVVDAFTAGCICEATASWSIALWASTT